MKSFVSSIILLVCFCITKDIKAQKAGVIDGVVTFEDTVDFSAEPSDSIKNFSGWFLSNMNAIDNNCIDPDGVFFFDIYILSSGKVTKWALIQEIENDSCVIGEVDVWKIPLWIPARKNGVSCNQHLKIKTHIRIE